MIVFIHGGSNGGRQPITAALFDASSLATQGHVIVVTLNYRFGVLGEYFTYISFIHTLFRSVESVQSQLASDQECPGEYLFLDSGHFAG